MSTVYNPDYHAAMKHYREGRFNSALDHFTWALDDFLYKYMQPISDPLVKDIQAKRLECFRKIRES